MSDDLSIHHSFTKDGNGENNGNSTKPPVFDLERQATTTTTRPAYTTPAPKSLGSGSAMGLGAFGTTLTTLSLSLMEWRGVKTENVFVCNFFFVGALGLVITAQWEQSVGNGFAYTVFSAFGLFYAGFGALLTPAFGISQAYGSDTTQYNNAVAFWMTLWTIFMFSFLIASLSANIAYIIVFIFLVLGFLFVAASYYASADGNAVAALALKKVGGAMCFVAGLTGWYIVFQIFVKNELGFELPLGDTSRYFKKKEL